MFDYDGQKFLVQRFQSPHDMEYIVYETQDGEKPLGRAQLFKYGILQMSWYIDDDNKTDSKTIYDNGIVQVITTDASLISDSSSIENEVRLVENIEDKVPLMEILKDGVVVYRGEYDLQMNKSGYGIEYDEKGIEKCYAYYENNECSHIFQEFVYLPPVEDIVNDLRNGLKEDKKEVNQSESMPDGCVEEEEKKVMIEYYGKKEDKNALSIIRRQPIYIGGYTKIGEHEKVKYIRHGEGREFDELTGVCTKLSQWMNGVEEKGKARSIFNGWFGSFKSEKSLRIGIMDKEVIERRKKRDEENIF